ncbi:2-oxo acid dehydrogenase subunit E2 [Streptomyces sp. NPDC002611]
MPLDAAAEKFLHAHRHTPSATIWADADATGRSQPATRACLSGLAAFPELNAPVDTSRAEIVRLPHVHLGFAAQTEHGLGVPVMRDADRLPLDTLAAELRPLTDLARRDSIPACHLTGGTAACGRIPAPCDRVRHRSLGHRTKPMRPVARP